MPKRYHVIISPEVIADLAQIHAYINSNAPQNALKVTARLMSEMDSLEYFPSRYALYPGRRKLTDEVRRMPSYPFLIYYHMNEQAGTVEIITIRHGARLQPLEFP